MGSQEDTIFTLMEFVFLRGDRDHSNHSNNKSITSKREKCYVSEPREGLIYTGMLRVGLSGRAMKQGLKEAAREYG